jgi:hypothetical protein
MSINKQHKYPKNKRKHGNYRDDYRDRRDGNDRERDYTHDTMNDGSHYQRPQQYDQGYNNGRNDYQRHNNDLRQSDQQWQQNKLSRSFSGSRTDTSRGGNPRHLVLSCNIDHHATLMKASATKPIEIASFSITDGVRTTPGSVVSTQLIIIINF